METRVLFLTNNANLGSTSRILQNWLLMGREHGLLGHVAVQQPGPFAAWLEQQDVPHRVTPMPWPDRWRPARSLWHAWRLARWARARGVQVVHCNEHDVYPFALVLRRMLRLPLVCHVRFAVERGFARWAWGAPSRCPDALLWTSQQQRDDCAEAVAGIVPKQRQHLVRLGVNLETFGRLAADRERFRSKWGLQPENIVLGTASALRPVKRLEDFVRVVESLAKEDPRVVGLIAGPVRPGEQWYRDQILAQMKETGLGDRLRWLQRVDPVEPFYHACDIFISTSQYETFGNSVCEAMACRVPVAAYRGGSVHEVVGEAGCVVETGDLPALIGEVRALVQNPERRQQLGEQARRRVEQHFNPSQSLGQILQLYQQLLAGSQPASSNVPLASP